MRFRLTTLLAAVTLAACSSAGPSGPTIVPPEFDLTVSEVASGLSNPLYVTSPGGDPRLFIVEQGGRIRIVKNGQLLQTPFLDISSRISSGGERGLLSVAFHPSYAANGFFFVNFTDLSGNTRVERFRAGRPDSLPRVSKIILTVASRSPITTGAHLFGHEECSTWPRDGGRWSPPERAERGTLLENLRSTLTWGSLFDSRDTIFWNSRRAR